jgi:hypothetical protein
LDKLFQLHEKGLNSDVTWKKSLKAIGSKARRRCPLFQINRKQGLVLLKFLKRLMAKYFQKILLGLLLPATAWLLPACGTGMGVGIRKTEIKFITKSFSGTFLNKPYKVHAKRYGVLSLSETFEIADIKADTVGISFDENSILKINYWDGYSLRTKSFNGVFTKKGYYEVFLHNVKKEIPPFFPIIYSHYDVKRIRVVSNMVGELIIDHEWQEGGSMFILAAGDSGRRRSYFRKFSNSN